MRMKNAPKLFLTRLKRCIKVVIQSRKHKNSIGPEHRAFTVSDYGLFSWHCLKSRPSTFSSRTEVTDPSKSLACDLDTAQLFLFQLSPEKSKAMSCVAKAASKHKAVGWGDSKDAERNTGRRGERREAQTSRCRSPPPAALRTGTHQARLPTRLCETRAAESVYTRAALPSRSPSWATVGRATKDRTE